MFYSPSHITIVHVDYGRLYHALLLQRIHSSVSVGHSYNLIEIRTRKFLNVETASRNRISVSVQQVCNEACLISGYVATSIYAEAPRLHTKQANHMFTTLQIFLKSTSSIQCWLWQFCWCGEPPCSLGVVAWQLLWQMQF